MQATTYSPTNLQSLPQLPGIYQFFSEKNQLLYIGKANNLRQRIRHYFQKTAQNHPKTRRLVEQIHHITCLVVNSPHEALLLENNLIKAHQPPYNMLLRDDKTFPYLCLTEERFPRLIPVRQTQAIPGTYFGPYTNLRMMRQILELIRRLYPLRTCKYLLSEKNIEQGKFKVCLEFHMGNCKAPCVGKQTEAAYMQDIEQIKAMLKGHFGPAKQALQQAMQTAAEQLQFELAQTYKEKLQALEQYQAKSLVVNPKLGDMDVIALSGNGDDICISYLQIRQGITIFGRTTHVRRPLETSEGEILRIAAQQLRSLYHSTAAHILTPQPFDTDIPGVVTKVPKTGDKKALLQMAIKNAQIAQQELVLKSENRTQRMAPAVMQLQQDLQLKHPPVRIECFDNAHLQGDHLVGAMSCFVQGKPAKKQYRQFILHTTNKRDDYAAMREMLTRRYQKALDTPENLPDLLVVDGGKGQLNTAVQVLQELGLYGKLAVISIAKRLEEIYYPNDPIPLHLSKQSAGLHLLQQLRDEAHRFAGTFHRKRRSQALLHTQLRDIAGIGKTTEQRLLSKFGSLQGALNASPQALEQEIGKARTAAILSHFRSKSLLENN